LKIALVHLHSSHIAFYTLIGFRTIGSKAFRAKEIVEFYKCKMASFTVACAVFFCSTFRAVVGHIACIGCCNNFIGVAVALGEEGATAHDKKTNE
jgi:hypothetical protein